MLGGSFFLAAAEHVQHVEHAGLLFLELFLAQGHGLFQVFEQGSAGAVETVEGARLDERFQYPFGHTAQVHTLAEVEKYS